MKSRVPSVVCLSCQARLPITAIRCIWCRARVQPISPVSSSLRAQQGRQNASNRASQDLEADIQGYSNA